MPPPDETTLTIGKALRQLLAAEPTLELFASGTKPRRAQSLDQLYEEIHTCTKCPLGFTRTKFVFGVGNPKAEILFIGEAPGRDEDLKGEPFVGRAGQLLDKMLAAIDLSRGQVYIANILKCRPPENRDPLPEETNACLPHLAEQIRLLAPPFICAMGRIAAQILLDTKTPISKLRGQFYELGSSRLLVTFHPAALLRNPEWKKDTWKDLQALRRAYDDFKGRPSRF
ncbi:MAG: uracil-DNA glycosylase [candidate division Zixibacteria bacterium]|nr:uracil-DNA glycosylase [candidate division Zixibacteria bacterium]